MSCKCGCERENIVLHLDCGGGVLGKIFGFGGNKRHRFALQIELLREALRAWLSIRPMEDPSASGAFL